MSKIISISVDNALDAHINDLQKSLGYKGRSELLRHGISLLSDDLKENLKLKGNIDAALLVIHNHQSRNILQISHEYEEFIKSHIHHHVLEGNKCLELFLLKGPASKVKALKEQLQVRKKIEFVKLLVF